MHKGLDAPAVPLQGFRVVGQPDWDEELDRRVDVCTAKIRVCSDVAGGFKSLPHLHNLTTIGGFPEVQAFKKVFFEEGGLVFTHPISQSPEAA
jgi:hypothetical protein